MIAAIAAASSVLRHRRRGLEGAEGSKPGLDASAREGVRKVADAGIAKAMGQQAGTPELVGCWQGRFLASELKD
jgi:hypothetical protein